MSGRQVAAIRRIKAVLQLVLYFQFTAPDMLALPPQCFNSASKHQSQRCRSEQTTGTIDGVSSFAVS